jgi:hypothetical protein
MSRVERDPERGRAAAAELKLLGAKKILINAAEQGYITQLACKMRECFCPEELGGACYFEPVTAELSDWMPTHEHSPVSKREGGKVAVDNAILAHRLCNRIDYSISVGRSYASDLKRIRKAREDAIRRNNEGPDALDANLGGPSLGGHSRTLARGCCVPCSLRVGGAWRRRKLRHPPKASGRVLRSRSTGFEVGSRLRRASDPLGPAPR